eukprot:CAMPEP_0113392732 /NCGR_PEP_ID=MMETSP0013_2-20120614/11454_1 /TAXON_ID=2843 ORGANISM="Skeletonema costatum, Strain 1716" /NCGR_SAMPLE_ID=MMETSP0013_2 /ASSEMBLY_ACC=CAM_ASM_000158 /LENGTH=314 /DNA_ID=CAMNT_0000276169 /DNA_START=141 /DNA_END=1085 /DNA_ORIENTATION=+ /assembly_acc=CAM_ASM_000158
MTRSLSSIAATCTTLNNNNTASRRGLDSSSSLASHMSLLSLSSTKSPSLLSNIRTQSTAAAAPQKSQLGEPITFLTLNNLADNPGAVKRARRVGRGIGSSKGKTCGRGHKGQKSRAGKGVHPTFEGGQTKFYKRLPKMGRMKNAKFKLELIPLNVGKVQDYVTMGRLVPERSDGVLTMRDFVKAGMFPASSIKSGVKLLGDGKTFVKDKLLLEVPWASASAIAAIEANGGYVTTVHYNRLALRAHLKPHKFPTKPKAARAPEGEGATEHDKHLLPKRARPPPKYMQYYTDYEKRGYLNPRVQLERKQRGLKDIL